MNDIYKPKAYHFFHSGLEHHNQHMLTLFKGESNAQFEQIIVSTDPHDLAKQDNYDIKLTLLKEYLQFIRKQVNKNDILVIHGLYTNWHYLLPLIAPKLAKRVVWDIWGDDYFSSKRLKGSSAFKDKVRYFFRSFSVPKFGALAGFDGDVKAVKEHFSFNNRCFQVNHPLRHNIDILATADLKQSNNGKIHKVLIGNSGSRSNEHLRAIEQLKLLPNFKDLALFCIFSTDVDQTYFKEFKSYIEVHQIANITIIEEMMAFEDFISFIEKIDVIVFPHKRQQGVGTANLSLLLGKPVFMDKHISTSQYYKNQGITIFDVDQLKAINDFNFDLALAHKNKMKIGQLFGRESVKKQWKAIIAELAL